MRRLILIVTTLLIAVGIYISPVNAQVEQLKVTLTPLSPVIQGDADILLRVTISNPSVKPVTVPVWQIPQDDIPTPILKITGPDGQTVPYTGPLVKWSAEALKTGVTFAPKSSRVFVIELSSIYEIGNGRYRIDYSQDGPGKYDSAGSSTRVFGPIAPAYIETRGRTINVRGLLSPSPAITAASLTTSRCTTSQKTTITTAITDATNYAAGASQYFTDKAIYSNADIRYTTWFGATTDGRWAIVDSKFDNIYSAFLNASITVDCSCKKKTVYAYVYSNQPYKMFVCGAFWTARPTGTDSKAGTLIHEMSHFTVVAATDDHAYGQTAAKSLAVSDPVKATNNADSYEYFAENTPALP